VDGWGWGALVMLGPFLWDRGLTQRFAGMFSMVREMGVGGVACLFMAQRGGVKSSAGQGGSGGGDCAV